jgi:hypothetical protein
VFLTEFRPYVSEVSAASIIRAIMEAARASETSVDIQLRTRQYIPEDYELRVLIRLRNPGYETAEVLTRSVVPLLLMMVVMILII